jgi:hypothetical protein
MFKIPLLHRKEEGVLAAVGVGILLLVIVNIVVLAPALAAAVLPGRQQSQSQTIDTDSIQRAIDIIHGR